MDIRLPRVQSGERLIADHINAPNRVLEQLAIHIGPNSGIGHTEGRDGSSYWVLERNVEIWARITGGTNPYSWTEQYPQAAGAWSDGGRSGTTSLNSAYETTGNTGISSGTIVRLFFNPSTLTWSFQFKACS